MVPTHLRPGGRGDRSRAARIVPVLVAALAIAGCRGRPETGGQNGTAEERAAYAVRDRYTATDAIPAAAWAWTSPAGTVFVMVDVQSAVEGVVQAVADLWSVADGTPTRVARSQVMPSVASMRSFAFEDLTGDGLPDFFGAVADSAEAEYPVFLPGARANLIEEIEAAGVGYHFDTGEPNVPAVLRAPGGAACALQIWASEPAPDSMPAGWRFLALLRGGQLDQPLPLPPACGG